MKRIVIDFETYYGPDYSLSKREWTTESYIRDERFKPHGAGIIVGDKPYHWFDEHQLPQVFAAISWHDVGMVGHNLAFDGSILKWRYGYTPKLYIDTLGMSRALIGQHSAKHGLDALGQLLWNDGKTDILKATYGLRDLPPDIQHKLGWVYCKDDCEKTLRLFKHLAPHFPVHEYRVLDWTIRKFVDSKLYLDDDMLESYLAEVIDNKEKALERAGLADRTILMSNPKYALALQALGVRPPTKVNAKGEVKFAFAKTDADHKALLEHDNPDVQALVSARLQVKTTIEETRAAAYLGASRRGEWPVAYNYSGAYNTHRFSGHRGGGGNPMNLKRGGRLRDAIMAPHGYVLIVFDLSQIECRMTLWYGELSSRSKGQEREALTLMANGGDLYSYFAGLMFMKEINKKEHPNERQIGKSAVLGLGFGMGPARFMDYSETMGAKGVDGPLAEATVALYRNTYSGVRAMWRSLESGMKHAITYDERWEFGPTKIVKDPLFDGWAFQTGDNNLLVKYPDLNWDAENQATYRDGNTTVNIFGGKFLENIVQNGARIVLTDKLMEVEQYYECAMSTYDELVALVPDDEQSIQQAIQTIEAIMVKEHPLYPGLPIGVEYGYHKRYGKAKS